MQTLQQFTKKIKIESIYKSNLNVKLKGLGAETNGLYYKTITIVIMTIISDATNCGVTNDHN
jgi:hypothetical protein